MLDEEQKEQIVSVKPSIYASMQKKESQNS